MQFRFLLEDVIIKLSQETPKIDPIDFSRKYSTANHYQFSLHVKNVGEFYAENGELIIINPLPGVDSKTIELYLNGSVLGAILHQRQILALHGSSFNFNDATVIICGDSGFGKSSITLIFCMKYGAQFLTDDITPIQNGMILPISEKLKIWEDLLESLGLEKENLTRIHDQMDKYYLELKTEAIEQKPSIVFFGEIHKGSELSIIKVEGAEKFERIFNNQYWEELTTSTENRRKDYFKDIMKICENTLMFVLARPEKMSAQEVSIQLSRFIVEET